MPELGVQPAVRLTIYDLRFPKKRPPAAWRGTTLLQTLLRSAGEGSHRGRERCCQLDRSLGMTDTYSSLPPQHHSELLFDRVILQL